MALRLESFDIPGVHYVDEGMRISHSGRIPAEVPWMVPIRLLIATPAPSKGLLTDPTES